MNTPKLFLIWILLLLGVSLRAAPSWSTVPTGNVLVGASYIVSAFEPPPTGYQGGSLPVYLYKNNSLVASGTIGCGVTTSDSSPGVVTFRFVSWSGATLTRTVTIVSADAPPFGLVGAPAMLGNPYGGNTITTGKSFRMDSWVADEKMGTPVSKVEVFVDGVSCGLATLGQLRQDVADHFGDQRYKYAGYYIDTPATIGGNALSVGVHTISAKAWDDAGNVASLGSMNFDVVANQAPFGCLDTEFAGEYDTGAGSIPISGWAVDPDTGAPVTSVAIMVDGSSKAICTLGQARPDVGQFFNRPDYANSGISGAIPIGTLSPGTHQVSLLVKDSAGASWETGKKSFTVVNLPPRIATYSLEPLRVLLGESEVTVKYTVSGTNVTQVVLSTNPQKDSDIKIIDTWSGQSDTITRTVTYKPTSEIECKFLITAVDSLGRKGTQTLEITKISNFDAEVSFAGDGIKDGWKIAHGYPLTSPLQLEFEIKYDKAGRLDTYSGQTIHQDIDVDEEGSVLTSTSSEKKP